MATHVEQARDDLLTVTSEAGHRYVLEPMTARDYLVVRRVLRLGEGATDEEFEQLLDRFAARVVECEAPDPLDVPIAEAFEVIALWVRGVETAAVPPEMPAS
jgi:hypothetical protein